MTVLEKKTTWEQKDGARTKCAEIFKQIHFFFIRTSKFCLRLAILISFKIFEAEMFLICFYFTD